MATSGTLANGQVPCPNIGIWKIGPHINEPKFYTHVPFDLLVFGVIWGPLGTIISK